MNILNIFDFSFLFIKLLNYFISSVQFPYLFLIYPVNFAIVKKKKPLEPICPNILRYVAFYQRTVDLFGAALLEKNDSFFQKLLGQGWNFMSNSHFHSGLWSGLGLHRFLCILSQPLLVHMCSCHSVPIRQFLSSFCLVLHSFCPFFRNNCLILMRRKCSVWVLFRAEHSEASYSVPWQVVGLCVNNYVLQIEASLVRVKING